jgi:hypothetical protein
MAIYNEEISFGISYFSAVPGAYRKWGKGALRLKSGNDRLDSAF